MAIVNGYVTLDDLKLRLGVEDPYDDEQMELAIEAASRWVDNYLGTVFYETDETRVFPIVRGRVELDDATVIDEVHYDETGDGTYGVEYTTDDYYLSPQNSVNAPFRRIQFRWLPLNGFVQVAGTWGRSEVPATVRLATLILAAEYLKLKDAPFGVAGYGEFGAVRIRDNPVVVSLLSAYRRGGGVLIA